jgi:hypothetical protein
LMVSSGMASLPDLQAMIRGERGELASALPDAVGQKLQADGC